MTLNKECQYAALFCMYLCRAGRTTVKTAALNMKLSHSFLDQVARRLRLAGMIVSIKGPGGGFELVSKEITLGDIVASTGVNIRLLCSQEAYAYGIGTTEQRAFAYFAKHVGPLLYAIFDVKLTDILNGIELEDKIKFDSLDTKGVMQ